MAFATNFLDELKARVDLVDLISKRVKLTRKGREFQGLCPFHNEKTPSFTVSVDKGFFHCFGCGTHGSAIDFITKTEGLSFPEAVERLAGLVGMSVPKQTPSERDAEDRRKSLREVTEIAAQWFQSQLLSAAGAKAYNYLLGRGVDEKFAEQFQLGYAPDRRDSLKIALQARGISEAALVENGLLIKPEDDGDSFDRFRERLMFPITDRRGQVIAFGGRALGKARAKYLNSPETPLFQKGRLLYNLAPARQAAHDGQTVIAVEGYMDVIALVQAGFEAAVAPLGTALTELQLAELWRLAPEPVLCFDGDEAGTRAARRAAERALPLLRPGQSLKFASLPAGEDPDDLIKSQGRSAMQNLLNQSLPLSEFLWQSEIQNRRLDTPERRAGLRRDMEENLRQINDATVRDFYLSDLQARLDSAFQTRRGGKENTRSGKNFSGGRKYQNNRKTSNKYDFNSNKRLSTSHSLGGGQQANTFTREKILLSSILVHIELIQDVFDELAALHLSSPDLDNLRREILKHGGLGEPLDIAALKNDLPNSALLNLLDGLADPKLDWLEPITQPQTPIDRVASGWLHAFRLHQLDELRKELHEAELELGRNNDEEGFARFRALQDAVRNAEAEAIELDEY